MSTVDFYSNLPAIDNWLEITNPSNFSAVPEDWWVIVTDIVGSTRAIAAGRYKDVNLIGACSIIAVLNVAQQIEVPFVFGGDGATMLIPPQLLAASKPALLATQVLAQREFDLELRVGFVPVADILAAGQQTVMTKLRISENYCQGIFMGGGLACATDWVKTPGWGDRYQLTSDGITPRADFSGLECRWQDIPSQHGETVSLLVMATETSDPKNIQVYREVIQQIQMIYGDDDYFHPVVPEQLRLAFGYSSLFPETRVRSASSHWWQRFSYLLRIQIENTLGWLFMRFRLTLSGMNWGKYPQIVVDATDYRKFDDMLRMVISGNTRQRQQLIHYLENRYRQGKLVYGLHVSDRALMTCLVFERNGRQVHFIDGADGGYALAARAMKARARQTE